MLTEMELEEKLQRLAQSDFSVSENEEGLKLVPEMLNQIGSTNSHLRDDLIYSAFGAWILDSQIIGPAGLRAMLPVILDEQHLLYRIGEQNTDSVFTRSFSVLLLPLLLTSHRSQPFLTQPEIIQVKEKLLFYLRNEKDRRGFVPEKGWAHAMAHAADALDDLVQCVELGKADLDEVLEAIRGNICVSDTGYISLEDERSATPVIAVIRRQLLSDMEIGHWIQSFAEHTLPVKTYPDKLIIRANVKNFLQSLYFRLQWELATDKFAVPITATLKKINPFAPADGGEQP